MNCDRLIKGLLVFGLVFPCYAQTGTTIEPEVSVSQSSHLQGDSVESRMTMGALVGVNRDRSNPGFHFGIHTQLVEEIGLLAGVDFNAFFVSNQQASAVVLGTLPTVFFEWHATDSIHPLLGIEIGPVFGVGDAAKALELAFLLKTGVNVDVTPLLAFNLELRMGVVGSLPSVIPHLGATFAL